MRAVEDAIARQVFHGGDLATNLLEVGAIREDALLPILAESVEMPPAPFGKLPAPPPRVLRLVPGELALRHGIFPLEQWDRALVVATAEPLAASVEDDLGFALDLAIRQVIAPLVRIRQAIAEHYGIPLERRFLRLVAKLDGQVDPSPSAAPPPGRDLLPVKMPRPISIPSPSFGTGVPSSDVEPGRLFDNKPPAKTPFVAAHDFVNPSIPKSPGLPRDAAESLGAPATPAVAPTPATPAVAPTPATPAVAPAPAAASPTLLMDAAFMRAESFHEGAPSGARSRPSAEDFQSIAASGATARFPLEAFIAPSEPEQPEESFADLAASGPDLPTITASNESPVVPHPPSAHDGAAGGSKPASGPRPVDPDGTRALAGLVKKALRAERVAGPIDKTRREGRLAWRAPNRRKGPFTAAMAERELEEATASDAVLEILFAFSQQFFEYTAIFVVQGDLAEGRDAGGPGADRAAVAAIGVPLDLPSSLARARDRRAPWIGRLESEGLDADLARDLGRAPRAVALLPVTVKTRVVAILYGDDGAVDVELSGIGEVLAVIGLAGAALERIALRRKLAGRLPEIPVRVRIVEAPSAPHHAVETRAPAIAALARAVTTTTMEAAAPSPAAVAAAARAAADPEVELHEEPLVPDALDADEPVVPASPDPDPSPPVAMFSSIEAAVAAEAEAIFDVAPPDDDVLPPSQGPRTARYFGEPRPAAPPVVMPSLKQTAPGIGITFPDSSTPPPPAAEPDDDLSLEHKPSSPPSLEGAEPPPKPRAEPSPGRRRLAPVYEGRSAARAATPAGFEPLPSTPPPNATAWTSFPSIPPPEAVLAPRQRSDRPIPREDRDDRLSPEPAVRSPRVDHATVPSVVVDVGAEYQSLLARVVEGGAGSQEAFGDLVRSGEHAIGAVMARFPGPLRVDRHRARAELPAASQCGPILELVVAIRRPALPFVSVRLSSPDPEIRFWATHLLGELRYPEAGTALLPRLFDDDPAVRRIARRSAAALVGAGAAGGPVLKGLDDIIKNPEEPAPSRVLAIETMGEIRSGALVPSLVAALEYAAEDIAEAARRALLVIARQDFGRDGDRWREWWARNGNRHRIEWLIDALMHDQPAVRRAAGDELKALTKEYFGYYDDLPKRERERAQQLYRTWWEREGRARFAT
ncbi:MAG: hypothetical protein QM820_11425 [Minicystis sp.]